MGMTDDGKNIVRDFLAGTVPTAPTHVAFGTGSTAFNSADTTLESETTRIAIDTTTTSNKKVVFNAALSTAQGNGALLTELGLLNADSAGDLFQRTTFNGVTKNNTISIQAIVTVRIL